MTSRTILVVMAATLFSTICLANEPFDGNGLLRQCGGAIDLIEKRVSKVKPSDATYCIGLVSGVKATLEAVGPKLSPSDRTCFPEEGISMAQAVRIVEKDLRDNPSSLHLPGTALVIIALKQAYPCKGV